MLEEKKWEEFIDAKMVWWINRIIHLFGWAICYEIEKGEVVRVYPARCKFRGFSEASEDAGFIGLSKFLKDHADKLYNETIENEGEM